MGCDPYGDADDLVVLLRAGGADGWADAINDAIESGSTGTEILMALRHQLTALIGAEDVSSEARRRATRLKVEIEGLLEK